MRNNLYKNMRDQMNPTNEILNELLGKINNRKKAPIYKKVWLFSSVSVTCLAILLIVVLIPKNNNQNIIAKLSLSSINDSELIPLDTANNLSSIPDDLSSTANDLSSTTSSSAKAETSQTDPYRQSLPSSSDREAAYTMPIWDDLSYPEKFSELTYKNVNFITTKAKIDKSEIKDFISKTSLNGTDTNTKKVYKISAEIYSVKSIESKFLIAVKYEGQNDFYSFIDDSYVPATLGDLIDDLDLHNNLILNNKIYYSYWKDGIMTNNNYIQMEYSLPNASVVWDLLLSDRTATIKSSELYSTPEMDISIDVKIVGQSNISLAVTKDGYLQTNIFNTAKVFYIGQDKTKVFVDYVLKNGHGIKINNSSSSYVEP